MGLKIFCVLVLGIFACSKVNQLKQPTKVCFSVDINEETAVEGKLLFNSGHFLVESLDFDGKRREGVDVAFTRAYTNDLVANLGEKEIGRFSFDIPQGNYTAINMALYSYDENSPNIVLNASFQHNNNQYPVRFELDEPVLFQIQGKNGTSEEEISLIEKQKTRAIIEMNVAQWFESISAQNLERATLVMVDGKETILINKTTNISVYNTIRTNLNKNQQKAIFEV